MHYLQAHSTHTRTHITTSPDTHTHAPQSVSHTHAFFLGNHFTRRVSLYKSQVLAPRATGVVDASAVDPTRRRTRAGVPYHPARSIDGQARVAPASDASRAASANVPPVPPSDRSLCPHGRHARLRRMIMKVLAFSASRKIFLGSWRFFRETSSLPGLGYFGGREQRTPGVFTPANLV